MLSQSSADDAGNRANVCARIVAPVLPLVTLEQARLHLRLDAIGSPAAHPDDALIQALVQSATDELDGWNGDLGRALVTQTWEYAAPFFNGPALTLPLPPLQSVTSVRYLDEAGAEQTIDASNYRVRINGDMPGAVILNEGYSWPSHAVAEDAVRVRFVCGFGDDPDDVQIGRAHV